MRNIKDVKSGFIRCDCEKLTRWCNSQGKYGSLVNASPQFSKFSRTGYRENPDQSTLETDQPKFDSTRIVLTVSLAVAKTCPSRLISKAFKGAL